MVITGKLLPNYDVQLKFSLFCEMQKYPPAFLPHPCHLTNPLIESLCGFLSLSLSF